MFEAISAFIESNMLLVSISVFAITVAFIARSIFSNQDEAESQEFTDAEYFMDDNDVFVPPNDV